MRILHYKHFSTNCLQKRSCGMNTYIPVPFYDCSHTIWNTSTIVLSKKWWKKDFQDATMVFATFCNPFLPGNDELLISERCQRWLSSAFSWSPASLTSHSGVTNSQFKLDKWSATAPWEALVSRLLAAGLGNLNVGWKGLCLNALTMSRRSLMDENPKKEEPGRWVLIRLH